MSDDDVEDALDAQDQDALALALAIQGDLAKLAKVVEQLAEAVQRLASDLPTPPSDAASAGFKARRVWRDNRQSDSG